MDCAITNKYAGHVHGALFLHLLLCHKVDLQEKEQQKQQSIDEMRDKKTGLERTVELKRDMQGKKQQELRSVRAELQRLEGSSTRLQELENELAKVVRVFGFAVNFNRWLLLFFLVNLQNSILRITLCLGHTEDVNLHTVFWKMMLVPSLHIPSKMFLICSMLDSLFTPDKEVAMLRL